MMSPIDDIIQIAKVERALLWREVVELTPEQASFRPDLETWSIGMILEHLLIGEERLVARFAAAWEGKQLDDPLPPPAEIRFNQEDYPNVGKTGKRTASPNVVPQGTVGLSRCCSGFTRVGAASWTKPDAVGIWICPNFGIPIACSARWTCGSGSACRVSMRCDT